MIGMELDNGDFLPGQYLPVGSNPPLEEALLFGGTIESITLGNVNTSSSNNAAPWYVLPDEFVVQGTTGDDNIGPGYIDAGQDEIDGSDGNDDVIDAGTGADTVDAGLGNDTIADFDIGDSNGDGIFNDQLDVSALTDGGAGPITADGIIVTDDGSGNALLTFPNGETLVLEGVTPAQMTGAKNLNSAGIPCFAQVTIISVPGGMRAVETLKVGDLVVTRDRGSQPILWNGVKTVPSRVLAKSATLRPLRFAMAWTGYERPLMISPHHGVAISLNGTAHLAHAIQLARIGNPLIQQIPLGWQHLSYHHFLLPSHQVVFSNGVAVESLHPGPRSLRALDPVSRLLLLMRMPELMCHSVRRSYGPQILPSIAQRDLPHDLSRLSVLA